MAKEQDEGTEAIPDTESNQDGGESTAETTVDKLYSQDELDKAINSESDRRVAKAMKTAGDKAEIAKADADRDANEKRLTEQSEFEQLANSRKEELGTQKLSMEALEQKLETVNTNAQENEDALKSILKTQLKTLKVGKGTLNLLSKLSAKDQLNWLADNAEELNRPSGNLPETPRAAAEGSNGLTKDEKIANTVDTWS